MFTGKSRDYIQPNASFFYANARRQRRKKRLKQLFIATVIAVVTFLAILYARQSMAAESSLSSNIGSKTRSTVNPYLLSPTLVFNHPDPQLRFATPVDTSIKVKVQGLIAYAEYRQLFINPHSVTLDGQYQFPLPEEGAIHYLHMQVGAREIEGKIMAKPQARKLFNQAKASGKKVSLVNQKRPNLFTNELANVPAGAAVVITVRLMMPVTVHNQRYSLRLPSAMTKRYQPLAVLCNGEPACSASSSANEKAHQLTQPTQEASGQIDSKLTIDVLLDAGVTLSHVTSESHQISTRQFAHGQYQVKLTDGNVPADRSFQLQWQIANASTPQLASYHEQLGEDYYTLLTLYPPNAERNAQEHIHAENSKPIQQLARDMIFIIDTSGSMQGPSMAQAKKSLAHALLELNADDSFNVLAFDSNVSRLFSQTEMASASNIAKAQHFVRQLSADGGTEMYQPLSQALVMRRSSAQQVDAIRQIVFITDGAVTNELQLMQLLAQSQQNYRLYTVGIGAAPNGYFMKKAAQFGRGHYIFIQRQQDVLTKMTALLDSISKPQLTNLRLSFDNAVQSDIEMYPKRLPDLHAEQPLQVAIKSSLPINSFEISGKMATTNWYRSVVVDHDVQSNTDNTYGAAKLWARRKIADLLDGLATGESQASVKQAVTSTSLAHQILSPYTSLIAVEKSPPEPLSTPELAGKDGLIDRLAKSNTMAQESLQLMLPQTSLGWAQQLWLAAALAAIGVVLTYLSSGAVILKRIAVGRQRVSHIDSDSQLAIDERLSDKPNMGKSSTDKPSTDK
ncbi:marine proteobacterial sortase target protein [Thalassotalea euphylliae]|uniref:Marine proteobacterial sortase target protein n=1 Tax=Thalassotalea euphylliae TaxID=1655234 RepID=A0A3E0TMM8_9GAMM|nr:marine proteobacterial sortase target protein [Thalassotalea euphylliae]REL25786.1 marine proteobacterial sortase target protein [Thalassotalea euphylliae]